MAGSQVDGAVAGERRETCHMPRRVRLLASYLLFAAVVVFWRPGVAQAEEWTDSTGAFRIEAEFLGIRGVDVYLKKANGVTIKVPLDRLSADSQQKARQMPSARKPIATAAAADAPDVAVQAALDALRAGNLRAGWDAIPASYQQDVTEIVHTFAANMDPDLWKAGVAIAQKATQVLRKKKAFIVGHSKFSEGPAEIREPVEKNWDPIADLLELIATSELADLEKLKVLDVGAFLGGTGQSITDKMRVIQKDFDPAKLAPEGFPGLPVNAMPSGELPDAKVSTVQVTGDTATLRIESEGETKDVEYVRVEGKWMPKNIVDGWPDAIQKAKQALTTTMPEQLKNRKQQVLLPMTMAQAVLDQMLAAQTQEQFNQVFDGILDLMAPKPAPGGSGQPGNPAGSADPFGSPAP